MSSRVSRLFFVVGTSLIGTFAAACGTDTPPTEPDASNPIPVVSPSLNRGYTLNGGLVTNLDDRGQPVREGASMDVVVQEARRFYDTLGSPGGEMFMTDYPDPDTGAAPTMKSTAPMTFDDWKRVFNIPPRAEGETLEAYRKRTDTNVVVYYNKNELGLGRELGCAEFDDPGPLNPENKKGIACYVTNYGSAFRDMYNSLALAEEGIHSKNTVCISYRPSMEPGYEVQFYTYNGDGIRREAAQLDTLGPRPLPHVCVNCHGGSYDSRAHLAKNARFLPLDPNVVVFAPTGPVSREAQEEAIRATNVYSLASPLTSLQIEMLDKLYGGNILVPGTKSKTQWYPSSWDTDPETREMFDQVVKNNCTTCHAAMSVSAADQPLAIYEQFTRPQVLREAGLQAYVCTQFTMPNAQATQLNFWEVAPTPITLSGNQYPTAAGAMLEWIGITQDECAQLEQVSDCRRGSTPEADEELCGNKFSGKACEQDTGRCVPALGWSAPKLPTEPNGVCRTNGTRGCSLPYVCKANPAGSPANLNGYDGLCLPE